MNFDEIALNANTKKPRKKLAPRTWKTKEEAFALVWDVISAKLEIYPALTAKTILDDLIKDESQSFNLSQLRTLQRRVKAWRKEHLKKERGKIASAITYLDVGKDYLSVGIIVVVTHRM